ncbi:MAG: right-handed parallel beta-helix repeat-containing protein [Bacteroidetes bacterium]|nr:right-handed parallel beta-helix repeat-containing protein [Bacteroidota bacterium]
MRSQLLNSILFILVIAASFQSHSQPTADPGTALEFDGNDDYVNGNGIETDFPAFTIEAWVYEYSLPGDIQRYVMIDDVAILEYDGSSNGGNCELDFLIFKNNGAATHLRIDNVLVTNEWMHITATYSGTNMKLYMNGGLLISASVGGVIHSPTGGFLLSSNIFPLHGKMDEVRIWNRVLSTEEIRENMYLPLSGTDIGLKHYWQFNEGTGTTVADVIGSANGTLKNMTSADWVPSVIPFGAGIFDSKIEAGGTVSFTGTGVSMYYYVQNAAEVTVTRIDTTPNTTPPEVDRPFDSQYWIINRYGTGAFNTDLTFTLSENLKPEDQELPSRIKLYHRNSNSSGAWTLISSASSVDSVNNRATFNGISNFGQFMVCLDFVNPQEYPGTALEFQETNNSYVFGSGIHTTLTAITLEAWINQSSLPGDVQRYVTISPETAVLRYDGSSNGGFRELHFYIKQANGSLFSLRADSVLVANEWMHVAGTYDGTNMKLYLNGRLLKSASPAGGLYPPNGNFSFGNSSETFYGKMDEVRIWNRALTAEEIRENMYLVSSGTETGLINYWQFNDGSGTTVSSVVGNSNGIINNPPSNVWVTSAIPFGDGVADSQTEVTGAVSFAGTGVLATYTVQSGAVVTVTRIDSIPNIFPTGISQTLDSQYWVINRYGTGSFIANLTFQVDEDLLEGEQSTPGRIKLYYRSSNSVGAWTFLSSASSVNASGNQVTFNGISAYGQFIVCRNFPNTSHVPGNTLLFGGGYVDCGNNASLKITGHITIEAWIMQDWGGSSSWLGIAGNDNTDHTGYKLRFSIDGRLSFVLGNSTTWIEAQSGAVISPGIWTHVTGVYNGSKILLYVNGQLVAQQSYSASIGASTRSLRIGSGPGTPPAYFNSKIEELRIWSVARTESEIRKNMYLPLTGAEPGLVSYWQFNDNSGTTLTDIAGGNNGTLYNMSSNSWISSSIPFGEGVFNSRTETAGLISFTGTGVSADYTTQNGAVVTVARIDTVPNMNPSGSIQVFNSQYWVINRYGTGTYNANLTFTVDEDLLPEEQSIPSRIKLYFRAANSDGTWSYLTSGSGVDAVNNKVTFNGISTFGQFIVCRNNANSDNFPGTALDFPGSDEYVDCGNSANLNITSAITIEAWIKADVWKANSWDGTIVGKDDVDHTGYDLRCGDNGKLNFVIGASGVWTEAISGPVMLTGEWNHVTGVYDGSMIRVYINGKLEGEQPLSASIGVSSKSLFIGGSPGYSVYPLNRFFDGKIEEVRVWNVALTETEIRENMYLTLHGAEPGLISYWQFNNGSGETLTDVAGGNDGTLTGYRVIAQPWVTSAIPCGSGASDSKPEASGTVNFNGTGLSIYYNEHSGASVTVSRIDTTPNVLPTGIDQVFNSQYWVIKRYGTGSYNENLTFTIDEDFSDAEQIFPERIKLYYRSCNSTGVWSLISSAASVDVANNKVTFIGISEFGQFIVCREFPNIDNFPGTALEFDGNDDYVSGTGISTSMTAITIEAWIYHYSLPGVIQRYVTISPEIAVLQYDGSSSGGHGQLDFYIKRMDGSIYHLRTVNMLVTNEWIHVAGTYDGTNMRLYLNGKLVQVGTPTGGLYPPDGSFLLSMSPEALNGKMDEVRIWNRALTANEIRENMYLALAGIETGLNAIGTGNGTLYNMTSDDWISSVFPFGSGVSDTETETSGTVNFTGTGVSMNFTEQNAYEVNVTRIDTVPNTIPEGPERVFDSQYWVINQFGSTSFSANLTLTLHDDLLSEDQTYPSRIKLYQRNRNSSGAWTLITSASSVDAANNKATFNGVSSSGQFLVCLDFINTQNFPGTTLEFDGVDDYISGTGIDATYSACTIEAWIYHNSLPGNIQRYVEIRPEVAVLRYDGYINGGFRELDFYIKIPGGWYYHARADNVLLTNEWMHVAATYNGQFLRLYLNGKMITETLCSYGMTPPDGSFLLSNPTEPFHGKMDEVRIWNRALSAEEIRENMYLVLCGHEAGLTHYWQFNDGSGATLSSIVGNSNGTLQNMTSDDWITSDIPFGSGVSDSQTEATWTVGFTGTGVSANFTSPNGATVTVTRIDTVPNTTPAGTDQVFDSQYWVINRYGTGTYNANLTFTLNEDLLPAEQSIPGRIRLYFRSHNSSAAWTLVCSASSVNAANNTATFTGISNFGQFIICRGFPVTDNFPGTALDFDGTNDYVNCGNAGSLNITGTMTIEAWIKADTWGANSYDGSIVSKDYSTPGGYTLCCGDNGRLNFVIGASGAWRYVISGPVMAAGQWNHVAGVYDGSSISIYINGKLEGRLSCLFNPSVSSNSLFIGNSPGFPTRLFDGRIEEVRIWNVARTESEIRENMHLHLTGTKIGLVSYWQFNDGTGNRLKDGIDINNGTLVNMDNSDWVNSSVPFGPGTSNTKVVSTPGSIDYTGTGISMNFTSQTGTDTIVVTRIDTIANVEPTGVDSVFDTQYWIIHRYGTGTMETSISFTINEDLTTGDQDNPSQIRLFHRATQSDGNWDGLKMASAVIAESNTSTFSGIDGFSEFIVTRFIDTIPPLISVLSPVDNGFLTYPAQNLVITFNETVFQVAGKTISICKTGIGVVETLTLPDPKVTGTGTSQITIDPSTVFKGDYYVLVEDSTFESLPGYYFPGISSPDTWNFFTCEWGHITANTTWSGFKPICDDIYIDSAATLTIEPGTRVEFQGFHNIDVKGNIVALGTPADSIIFTVADTGGFYNNTHNGWNSIYFGNVPVDNDSSIFSCCIFEYGKGSQGGAIHLDNTSNIEIKNCTFRYNHSHSGGAIASGPNCNFSFHKNVVTHNTASGNGGGADFFTKPDPPLSIESNILSYNESDGNGGAVCFNGNYKAEVRNNIIHNNRATNGGAFYNLTNQSLIYTNNLIVQNIATNNGGAFFNCDSSKFYCNTISDNVAGNHGGAFYLDSNDDPEINGTIIYGNSANGLASQFWLNDTCSDPSFDHCILEGGKEGFLGPGSATEYHGSLLSCITDNPSFVGTGAHPYQISQLSPAINKGITDTTGLNLPDTCFDGMLRIQSDCFNRPDIGAYEYSGPPDTRVYYSWDELLENDFRWCADTVKVMKSLKIANGGTLFINPGTYVEFQGNYQIVVEGRLVAEGTLNDSIVFTVADTTGYYNNTHTGWGNISFNNVASQNDTSRLIYCRLEYGKKDGVDDGGALWVYNSNKLIVKNCLFQRNFAQQGGAVFVIGENSNYCSISNSVFRNNAAIHEGGGLFLKALVDFSNNIVTDNSASIRGGGIYCGYINNQIIRNSVIANNHGAAGGGIMFYNIGLAAYLINSTVYGNAAGEGHTGGGVSVWNGDIYLKNCIVYGNQASAGGPQIGSYGDAYIENCDIEGGASSEEMFHVTPHVQETIDANPQFTGSGDHPFSLQPTSNCINAGTSDTTGLNLPAYDIAGNERIFNGLVRRVDVGAYEYQGDPPSNDQTALNFDGANDYVNVIYDSSLNVGNLLTVEAWIKPDDLSNRRVIYTTRKTNSAGSWQLETGIGSGGTNRVAVSGVNTWVAQTEDNAVLPGEWNHIVYTRSGTGAGTHKIYVNGVLQNLTSNDGYGFVDNTSDRLIGAGTNIDQYFDGKIDEIRLWNIVRPENEIRENIHLPLTGTEPGLVSYWIFNDNYGSTLTDLAGSNFGALINMNDSNWVPSTIPFGRGYSNTHLVNTTGLIDFNTTGISMDFTAKTGRDSIVVSKINKVPNMNPVGPTDVFDSQYWVVHKYGMGTFNANITFNLNEELTSIDEANPANIVLYTRPSNADTFWVFLNSATSVNAATHQATFEGITGFSQFILGRGVDCTNPTNGGTIDYPVQVCLPDTPVRWNINGRIQRLALVSQISAKLILRHMTRVLLPRLPGSGDCQGLIV